MADIVRAARVSRFWRDICEDDRMWRLKCEREGLEPLPVPRLVALLNTAGQRILCGHSGRCQFVEFALKYETPSVNA